MSLADKVTKGTYDFVSLIVKKILSLLPLGLPLAAAEKKNSVAWPFKFWFYFALSQWNFEWSQEIT